MRRILSSIVASILVLMSSPTAVADNTGDNCSEKVNDTAHALSPSQMTDLNAVITKQDADLGADIHVLLWTEFSPDKFASTYTYTQAGAWWKDAAGQCSMWPNEDNLIVIGIGVANAKMVIYTGPKFRIGDQTLNWTISTRVRPLLKDHRLTTAVNTTLSAVHEKIEPPGNYDYSDVFIGFVLLVVILGGTWGLTCILLKLGGTPEPSPELPTPPHMSKSEARKRIAEIKSILSSLDVEWTEYLTNTEELCLTKPVLRDRTIPKIAKYHDLLFDLRDAVETLTDSVGEKELTHVEKLGENTLIAWADANDYALKVGVSDLSAIERTALRHIRAMVSQLSSPSTPRTMWDSLKEGIGREMDKLTTVPITWRQIAALPEIERAGAVPKELLSA